MTPLMRQYRTIKVHYPEALVLFQVGDFYELFYDDAQKASQYLQIMLTKRGKSEGEPIPLCGVPKHAADHYIMKLVQGGFHVVICDQQGEVEAGKLVERKVSAVITPGMLHDARLLDPRAANILAVITLVDSTYALWWFELITGRCCATIIPYERRYLIEAELMRLRPREVVVGEAVSCDSLVPWIVAQGYTVVRAKGASGGKSCSEWVQKYADAATYQFVLASQSLCAGIRILYAHVEHHVPEGLLSVQHITLYTPDDFLVLDKVTQRDLELVVNLGEGTSVGTLWEVLDESATAMGSRMVRSWILQPLCRRDAIETRLSLVEHLVTHTVVRKQIYELLCAIGDIERVAGRILLGRAPFHDYKALHRALPALVHLSSLVEQQAPFSYFSHIIHERSTCKALLHSLEAALEDDPTHEGRIKAGYHDELDKIRALGKAGEQAITDYEAHEREVTGITSLKVRLNGAYGYGIEATKAHRHSIPDHYKLVQSLVNRDRFTTPQLMQLEQEQEYAEKRAQELEQELFEALVATVREQGIIIRNLAQEVAYLDGIVSFAQAAVSHRYVRPCFTHDRSLLIDAGRHPVIEARLQRSSARETFVANSVHLSQHERFWIITGPNMGGKSTFLRQVALITIMAQAGSFVPAKNATLPIVDRLFTRIGAADRVNEGKSTFWVEMEEVARMCREATPRSLIILDEVGRGTSTYDGMALAQAILEYLEERVQAFGLCATHYHEVARTLGQGDRSIGLYHVAVARQGDDVVLLHSIRPGVAEGSFGLVIAEKAGVLPEIIARASEVLQQLRD
jgi:DNA mismatch repair protein MutS